MLPVLDFQKGLWMVDETEARWQRYILEQFPSLNYKEVYWESTEGLSNHTFENAVSTVVAMYLDSTERVVVGTTSGSRAGYRATLDNIQYVSSTRTRNSGISGAHGGESITAEVARARVYQSYARIRPYD
jgi:hypothetical protein